MTCAGTVGNDITGGIEHSLCRSVITCLILIMLMGSSVGSGSCHLLPVSKFISVCGLLCRCHISRSHIAGVLRTVSAVNSLLADRVRSHSIIGGKCANNDSAVGTWPLIQQGVRESDIESLGCHCLVIRSDVRHLTGEFQIKDDVSRETSRVE